MEPRLEPTIRTNVFEQANDKEKSVNEHSRGQMVRRTQCCERSVRIRQAYGQPRGSSSQRRRRQKTRDAAPLLRHFMRCALKGWCSLHPAAQSVSGSAGVRGREGPYM